MGTIHFWAAAGHSQRDFNGSTYFAPIPKMKFIVTIFTLYLIGLVLEMNQN